jgi:hypothetical protein
MDTKNERTYPKAVFTGILMRSDSQALAVQRTWPVSDGASVQFGSFRRRLSGVSTAIEFAAITSYPKQLPRFKKTIYIRSE